MTSQADILSLVVSILDSIAIPYMLSGSTALNFYATPRMTRDIDIVIELDVKDIEKLVQAFREEFYIDDEMIRGALRDELPFNIIHLGSITKIDLIPKKNTSYQKSAFERRRFLDFAEKKIAVISPEDLIVSKLAWAKESLSEVQLGDIRKLFQAVTSLDRGYIDDWVKQLDLGTPFSKVKK